MTDFASQIKELNNKLHRSTNALVRVTLDKNTRTPNFFKQFKTKLSENIGVKIDDDEPDYRQVIKVYKQELKAEGIDDVFIPSIFEATGQHHGETSLSINNKLQHRNRTNHKENYEFLEEIYAIFYAKNPDKTEPLMDFQVAKLKRHCKQHNIYPEFMGSSDKIKDISVIKQNAVWEVVNLYDESHDWWGYSYNSLGKIADEGTKKVNLTQEEKNLLKSSGYNITKIEDNLSKYKNYITPSSPAMSRHAQYAGYSCFYDPKIDYSYDILSSELTAQVLDHELGHYLTGRTEGISNYNGTQVGESVSDVFAMLRDNCKINISKFRALNSLRDHKISKDIMSHYTSPSTHNIIDSDSSGLDDVHSIHEKAVEIVKEHQSEVVKINFNKILPDLDDHSYDLEILKKYLMKTQDNPEFEDYEGEFLGNCIKDIEIVQENEKMDKIPFISDVVSTIFYAGTMVGTAQTIKSENEFVDREIEFINHLIDLKLSPASMFESAKKFVGKPYIKADTNITDEMISSRIEIVEGQIADLHKISKAIVKSFDQAKAEMIAATPYNGVEVYMAETARAVNESVVGR